MHRSSIRVARHYLLAATLTLSALSLATGCVATHRGETQIKWDKGQEAQSGARVLTALERGEYALYAIEDVKPKVVLRLRQGDPLGFEKEGDNVIAVAGEHRLSFPNGTYYWNYRGK